MTRPLDKPLLLFDGDCGFCRRWVRRWSALTGDRADYATFQEAGRRFPEIDPKDLATAVWLVEPGRLSSGAEAVFRLLALAPGGGWRLWAYRRLPGAAAASEAAYRFVARRRALFSRLAGPLWGPDFDPPTYLRAERLFLSGLALCFLCAFVSLALQVEGLLGSRGILPAAEFLDGARAQVGASAYRLLPTLFWLGASDAALKAACWGGALLSAAALSGLALGPLFLALWALYLSLVGVGQDFLSFQWDILLLEAGFIAALASPWRLRPARRGTGGLASPGGLLLRWLLFRLMFESGCVKLASGDPHWRALTALDFHYFTQPLPTWLAWWAQQLPASFQKLSTACMFAIELLAPFLIFAPTRPRLLAFGALVFLQLLIALTGNYGFFNLLTLALCALLLDDKTLERWTRLRRVPAVEPAPPPSRQRLWALRALAALSLFAGSLHLASMLFGAFRVPRPVAAVLRAAEPFRWVNGYGLFAVMTTRRLEISVEGSRDGKEWKEYEFRWKPGDPARRPRFVAPHQPRLDWQLWFAALGGLRQSPWFLAFLSRLAEGSPPVLGLLRSNPFPESPPRFLRALGYEYRFTDREGRKATGMWWSRDLKGLYAPVLQRRD